jgi:hypothetical protein
MWTLAPPHWNRSDLNDILSPASRFDSSSLAQARSAAGRGDWWTAHSALASHFAKQPSTFPLETRGIGRLVNRIRARFPHAESDSASKAEPLLDGVYRLLAYEDLRFGRPPRWDYDPVHDRVAPRGFWSTISYLNPAGGDHKIIWELNRHQHWLTLGRAYHLTSDRRYYDEFVAQLGSWLSANPPLSGINWASMLELGFRSLSWVWALHLFAGAASAAIEPAGTPATASASAQSHNRDPWTVDLLVGLDRQLTHVEHNLSRYFSPNTHLTGEALALYVCGATLPELAASARRMALGRDVLLGEIDRQIRADGGHAELSPHYHRYSTDFYLLAVLAARGSQDGEAARFEEAALRQARYLRALADDHGRLPLIGDDDGGQLFPICGREPFDCRDTLAHAAAILGAPDLAIGEIPEETFWLCGSTLPVEDLQPATTSWPSMALPSSGYYVSRNAARDHLVFDAGPHGFLNGGHAHSDALSIVLTVAGRPFLVDPGTATYTMDPAVRDLFRSTAMHNTIVMNGRPQSRPSGPFRWQSAAQGALNVWRTCPTADYAEGRHDGYRPDVHVRGVLSVHGFGWFFIDHFTGDSQSSTDAFWHMDPAWRVVSANPGNVRVEHRDGGTLQMAASGTIEVLDGRKGEKLGAFAGKYGRIEPAICVRCRSEGPHPRSVLTFVPAAEYTEHPIAIQSLAVELGPPAGWHGAGFHVQVANFEAVLMAAVEKSGTADSPDAGPPQSWGSKEVRTDGRVALVILQDGRPIEGLLVNGRELVTAGLNLSIAAKAPLVRRGVPVVMAHP